MSTNLVHYRRDGESRWGVIDDNGIRELRETFETTGQLIQAIPRLNLGGLPGPHVAPTDVMLLSPVTGNQQFVCQGANYRQHMIESGMDPDVKTYNMIFTKAPSCICAADSNVIKPSDVRFLDYEIELGLILGQAITGPVTVTEANLHEYVAGIVIVNDYSARDVQIPQMQFYKGKSFRTFGPVGPHLTLLDQSEMPLLRNLELHLTVNGETRQKDSTSNMVYGPAETLTELSRVQDFQPGDLVATGTPAGCALAIPSPGKQRIGALLPETTKWKLFFKAQATRTQYLQAGDTVEATIRSPDGQIDLGRQKNRIVMGG